MADDYDPRVHVEFTARINTEVMRYSVTVFPSIPDHTIDLSAPGSGTCIRIGGRFFIATAAHVIQHDRAEHFFIGTALKFDGVLNQIGRGTRGGRFSVDDDIAWIELHPRAAAVAERSWLDVQRIATYVPNEGPQLIVVGGPQEYIVTDHSGDVPYFHSEVSWWSARSLAHPDDTGGEKDFDRRLYLEWPRSAPDALGNVYSMPEAPGLSGGGVWTLNSTAPNWQPENIQFVGIEYSQKTSGTPYRLLRAYKAQEWLRMVAEDLPELAPLIEPVIAAGRHVFSRPQK